MAKVIVEAWPWLSELFGGSRTARHSFQVEIEEGATLGSLLGQLAAGDDRVRQALYGQGGEEPSGYLSALVNGRLPDLLEGYETPLREGDRVVLVQGFAGG